MLNIKNLKLKAKLSLLVAIAMVGLAVFGVTTYLTLEKVKIGGAMAMEIREQIALGGDLSPATLNILSLRLAARDLMLDYKDHEKFQKDIGVFEGFKKDFEEAADRWSKSLPESKEKELATVEARRSGEEYVHGIEQELIPALQRGDEKKAMQVLRQLLPIADQNWEQTAEADKLRQQSIDDLNKKAEEMLKTSLLTLFGIGLAAAVISCFLAYLIARSILGPVSRTVHVLQALADGDLRESIEVDSTDEIGVMGEALNKAINGTAQTIRSIASTAEHVARASEEFSASSQQIASNSEETSAQASTVSAATEQVSRNLQTVATGAEEMSATIKEVAKNSSDAARVASDAVKTAEATTATVSKLGESSAQVGQVIKTITSIAQQTNLLALNATIEAARAGEAGKGFAVVANEVKELAKQTAKATEDISQRIAAIQDDTKGAVDAIGTISGVINQINGISSTIATAVEEQSATTNEMTRNVTEAAKGAGEIAQNIHGMAEAARSTSNGAHESQKAAAQLAEMATQLKTLVDQFKIADERNSYSQTQKPMAMGAAAGN